MSAMGGVQKLLIIYYFNWAGNSEELKEFIGMSTTVFNEVGGLSFKGVFVPNSEWNYAMLYETQSFDKALAAFRLGMKKYGDRWQSRVLVSKNDILFTPEELGYSE